MSRSLVFFQIALLGMILFVASCAPRFFPPTPTPIVDPTMAPGSITGYVIKTTDGGKIWATAYSKIDGGAASISCSSPTNCIAVGGAKGMLTTSDGGMQWQERESPSNMLGKIVCVNKDHCFAFDNSTVFGNYSATSDGGNTWTNLGRTRPISVSDMDCPNEDTCFAVGINQKFFDPTYHFGPDPKKAMITASSDGGRSWQIQSTDTFNGLFSIDCPDSNRCIAVGHDPQTIYASSNERGVIVNTNDGGKTWTIQNFKGRGLQDIECPDKDICFAVGNQTVIKTVDGGKNWQVLYERLTDTPAGSDLSCPNTQTCYTASFMNKIWSTNDGGILWSKFEYGTNDSIRNISCPTVDVCYATGMHWK